MLIQYLTLRQVCRLLRLRARAIRELIAAGEFPAPVNLPRGLGERWKKGDIQAWQAQLECPEEEEGDDALSALARDILRVLREAGDWLHGAEIALRLGKPDCHKTGNWRRAIRELLIKPWIESSKQLGYRVLGPNEEALGPDEEASSGAS